MNRTAFVEGPYRYELTRVWDAILPPVGFVMLNPSMADAEVDDPTIRKCIGFAKHWGYGGIVVTNLYAWVATMPIDLWLAARRGADIIGPRNDGFIDDMTEHCDRVVAAWGANAEPARAAAVSGLLAKRLYRIGAPTKSGQPRHPLYLSYDTLLEVHR